MTQLKRKSHQRRVTISSENANMISAFIEECREKGISQASEQFQTGMAKLLSSGGVEVPERVACPIGVKHIRDYVYKPNGRENEPWWMHILEGKYHTDRLRGYTAFELELLIRDIHQNAGIEYATIPKGKERLINLLENMIRAAIKKNRDVAKCTQYDHHKFAWLPEEWCINCERACLKDVLTVIHCPHRGNGMCPECSITEECDVHQKP